MKLQQLEQSKEKLKELKQLAKERVKQMRQSQADAKGEGEVGAATSEKTYPQLKKAPEKTLDEHKAHRDYKAMKKMFVSEQFGVFNILAKKQACRWDIVALMHDGKQKLMISENRARGRLASVDFIETYMDI